MDMKRILQAMDGVATKPVAGANDMTKFLSIIDKNDVEILNEASNPHKVSLPVQMAMQHYQQPQTPTKPVGRSSTFGKYFHKVEEELDEAVAEEQAHRRQLINQYASVIAERVLMKEAANPAQQAAIAISKKKERQADESLKTDNPCWKGYKPVGTKKKNGKTVPNCVPSESVINEKSTTEKQARTMAAAAHNPAFAKKVGIKQSVAKEFNQKDKGTSLLSNAMKGKKKKVVNEFDFNRDRREESPLDNYPCYDCGSTIFHHHTKHCELAEPNAVRDLPSKHHNTQHWNGHVPHGLHPIPGLNENEIPGHSMGFTGGVGPGMQDYVVDETPLELDRNNPMASTIHNHKGANPGSIEYRIMRARYQLRDLAKQAESDSPLVWQHIARLFPELAMNIEQIDHGLSELKNIRSKGGRNSKNIPALEAVMPAIKAAKPATPKTVKPKAKTSACKAGQVQTGMQIKDGKSVPKCSVTRKK